MNGRDQLQATVDALVQAGKGILAADESGPTIAKRFKAIGVESTEENRRAYRNLLLATPGLGAFISGFILYEETLVQRANDGTSMPELAARQGIVPGIKVDAGKIALAHAPGDEITQGLDGLAKRLGAYKEQGARFAKWRAVYNVSDTLPSRLAIEANADALARYAAICQDEGVVPIVEPEVLMDGGHTLERCAEATEAVLLEVFDALHRHRVILEHMLLKPSMVVAGNEQPRRAAVAEVASETVQVLRRTVPAAVPGPAWSNHRRRRGSRAQFGPAGKTRDLDVCFAAVHRDRLTSAVGRVTSPARPKSRTQSRQLQPVLMDLRAPDCGELGASQRETIWPSTSAALCHVSGGSCFQRAKLSFGPPDSRSSGAALQPPPSTSGSRTGVSTFSSCAGMALVNL